MSEENDKPLSDRVVEKLKYIAQCDAEAEREYAQSWTRWTLGCVGLSGLIVGVMFLEKRNENLWEGSALWGYIIEIATTVLMVLIGFDDEPVYKSDGTRCKGQYLKKTIYQIAAWAPLYVCMVMRFELKWTKALWVSPLVFVCLFALALFESSAPVGFSKKSGGAAISNSPLTVIEMKLLRQNQELAGIDPDKFPLSVLNPAEAKSMTVVDWKLLKQDLRLAGYDIERKQQK